MKIKWNPCYAAPLNIYLKVFDGLQKTAKCLEVSDEVNLWVDTSGHIISPTHWALLDEPPSFVFPTLDNLGKRDKEDD